MHDRNKKKPQRTTSLQTLRFHIHKINNKTNQKQSKSTPIPISWNTLCNYTHDTLLLWSWNIQTCSTTSILTFLSFNDCFICSFDSFGFPNSIILPTIFTSTISSQCRWVESSMLIQRNKVGRMF